MSVVFKIDQVRTTCTPEPTYKGGQRARVKVSVSEAKHDAESKVFKKVEMTPPIVTLPATIYDATNDGVGHKNEASTLVIKVPGVLSAGRLGSQQAVSGIEEGDEVKTTTIDRWLAISYCTMIIVGLVAVLTSSLTLSIYPVIDPGTAKVILPSSLIYLTMVLSDYFIRGRSGHGRG